MHQHHKHNLDKEEENEIQYNTSNCLGCTIGILLIITGFIWGSYELIVWIISLFS